MSLNNCNDNAKCNLMSSSIQYKENLTPCHKTVESQPYSPICYECLRPILDQYLHNILDKYWHIQCLRCSDCEKPLSGRCFEKGGQLFCSNDYIRRACSKCSLCLEVILPNEFVRHSKDSSVFHLKCFLCVICRKELSTGDEYCLLENFRPVCKKDFSNIFNEISEIRKHDWKNNVRKKEFNICNRESEPIQGKEVGETLDVAKEKYLKRGTESFRVGKDDCRKSSATEEPDNLSFLDTDEHHVIPTLSNQCAFLLPENKERTRLSIIDIISENTFLPHNHVERRADNMDDDQERRETQYLTREKKESFPIVISEYDKDQDRCSMEEDLKSSFSAASSPCSNIKEVEMGIHGDNISNQTFQDDQQSMCHTESREGDQSGNSGTKRRGPRTTIKAKQLDTLKAAFTATPKPTRHVREQLAQDTGLTMRVIQVWFQNRRSKERRMKQLSAMGTRRPFFRNSRRMRSLSRGFGLEDIGDGCHMINNPQFHGYFGENNEFCNAIATLGSSFSSENHFPLGHTAPQREFFMPNSNQTSFLNLNRPRSLQNSVQIPPLKAGQLANPFNPSDHFTSNHCSSPELQFSQTGLSSVSAHNLIPGQGYLCSPQITSTGLSRSQSNQHLSSFNFVQAPIVGMQAW